MKQHILALILALTPSGLAAPKRQAACDKSVLEKGTAAYLDAQTQGKPDVLSAASAATYTQNFKTATLASGLLSQPQKIDHNRSTYDTTQCKTYTELIITDSKAPHVVGTQMTFTGDTISKIETIVTSTGDWMFNPTNTLKYATQENWDPIAEDKRDTREVIQAAADAYLDVFNNKSVTVPWGTPCARLEGGNYFSPCNVGVPSGVKNMNRRYVVDETMGTCDVMFTFAGADPDTHEFRVEGGKLRYVHTLTVMH
ncbi:hypothetical protein F5Y15DRAFT_413099 [Xylariaceae sp. FL0016]|nr:hypothetical protein F5Y15DRAFT_413099 [Xylariaceae sp. FL0016]